MFLKQYNYKPRSNSGSSGSDSAVDSTNTASAGEAAIAKANASAGRRRSSATEKFAGLQSYKRNSSDQAATEHRASLAEQKPGSGGVLSNMWQNFTKGS